MVHRAGGRYVTLVGSNPLFHLPQDRWPHAVDAATVRARRRAAAGLVVRLTRWVPTRTPPARQISGSDSQRYAYELHT